MNRQQWKGRTVLKTACRKEGGGGWGKDRTAKFSLAYSQHSEAAVSSWPDFPEVLNTCIYQEPKGSSGHQSI